MTRRRALEQVRFLAPLPRRADPWIAAALFAASSLLLLVSTVVR